MIKYSKDTVSNFVIKGEFTLSLFSLSGCNFNCYQCFNKDILKKSESMTINDVIQMDLSIYNFIIFNGGEYLINSLNDIINDINLLKNNYSGKIIIYTNGYYLDKIKQVYNLIDGIHLDMKLPYHYISTKDYKIIKTILGVDLNNDDIEILNESIRFIIKNDKGYNEIRTVKYPQLADSVFLDIKKYVNDLNYEYKKYVPYYINNFIKGVD